VSTEPAPSSAVSDRLTFWDWASGHPDLTYAEFKVLNFIVHRLLGLKDQRHWRGWAKLGLIADHCHIGERAARSALESLERRGWLERTSVRGREGRVMLSLPMVMDARKILKPRPFARQADQSQSDTAPSKTGSAGPVKRVENRAYRASKTGSAGPVNPSIESPESNLESSEKVSGFANASEAASIVSRGVV
jgi:hypothetical protein